MFPKSALAKAAALAAFGGVTLGGFAVAGALPGISQGTPPVSTPSPNSHAGDHPSLGAANGTAASSAQSADGNVPATTPPVPSPTATAADAGSRDDGLARAQANVTNPTASAVLNQIAGSTPGPGFGQGVAAATGAPAGPPASTPPVSTPAQADTGLSHKP